MLYFKISVSPVAVWGEDPAPASALGHVMVDETDVESAAARVVQKLYAARWRIISVHRACPVSRDERFRDDDQLAGLLREAENSGFAYAVDAAGELPSRSQWAENSSDVGISQSARG